MNRTSPSIDYEHDPAIAESIDREDLDEFEAAGDVDEIDLDDGEWQEQQRRLSIRRRAGQAARQRLKELGSNTPNRIVPGGTLPPLVRHLPPHNAVVPLPAHPKVPRKFLQMRSNADLIVMAMLTKYGVTLAQLMARQRYDTRANYCRQETAFRLLRFGRHRGLALSPATVGEMLGRSRTGVLSAARRFAIERGFDL